MENNKILIRIQKKMIKFVMIYKNRIHFITSINKNIKKWLHKTK